MVPGPGGPAGAPRRGGVRRAVPDGPGAHGHLRRQPTHRPRRRPPTVRRGAGRPGAGEGHLRPVPRNRAAARSVVQPVPVDRGPGLRAALPCETLKERTNSEAATVLGLVDEPLVFLERVRLLDDEPIGSTARGCRRRSRVRSSRSTSPTPRCTRGSAAAAVSARPTGGNASSRSCRPPSSATCSGWGRGGRVRHRAAGLDDRRPLEWRHSVVRGDRYSFVARWSGSGVATGMEPAEG